MIQSLVISGSPGLFSAECSESILSDRVEDFVFCTPNPTTGKVTMSVGNNVEELLRIRVYNSIGLLVQSEEILVEPSRSFQLNLGELSEGLDLIHAYSSNSHFVERVIRK